jgi:hypothetical protein
VENTLGGQIGLDLAEVALEEAVGLFERRRGAALGALVFD